MTSAADLRDPSAVVDLMGRAAEAMRSDPNRRGSAVRLPAYGRLLATGDLHDNPFHLDKIIRLARLDASPDHHVVLHEMIHGERLVNGLDLSYRMLARAAGLVLQYPQQVHPVLANHELAQMTGRGVSKGAGNSVELFDDGLAFAFGDEWVEVADAIRSFVRAMPLAVVSESGVLCAHSLPTALTMRNFDIGVLDRALTDEDYQGPTGAAYLMTWGRDHSERHIEDLALAWGIRLFCLGHEHAETGIETRGPRVVILNSDHQRATVLPLDLADIPAADEAVLFAMPLAAVGE